MFNCYIYEKINNKLVPQFLYKSITKKDYLNLRKDIRDNNKENVTYFFIGNKVLV